MSYEIVRSLGVKDNKVFISCASNNVFPRTYEREEWKSMTKLLNEKGRGAVDLVIMKEYESGNLQKGNNKYTRALNVLNNVFDGEYIKFDWRRQNAKYNSEEYHKERALRESKEFDNLPSLRLLS